MKKHLFSFLLFSCLSIDSFSQDWYAYFQKFDVTAYKGGEFKLTAFVKAESPIPKICQARLWARVDKKKGMGFFDNMQNRPITSNEWKEYSIEGTIDEKAEKLLVGGICLGFGKYYFDKFDLKVKPKTGDWVSLDLKDNSFESPDFQNGWKVTHTFPGFIARSTSETSYEGNQSFLVDGSSNEGKLVEISGINFYYEMHGKGDTVLFLHGNSESLRSFDKQIPEFSKQFFVIAMDSRAQGYSSDDGSKITYELMAEDVNALLEKLHMKKVNVVGWSDGGNIGLLLAMKHPDKVKKLATMGANLFNDKTSVEEWVNKILRKRRTELVAKKVSATDLSLRMTDLLLNEPKINPDDLKSIKCPTLVMAGSKDVIKENHTKLIASKIEKSKLVIFSKGDHYEPSKRPERFNKAVIDFFKEK